MLGSRSAVLHAVRSGLARNVSSASHSARQTANLDEFSQQAELKRQAEQNRRRSEDETDGLRDQLLESGLRHVPKLGWTTKALQAAAADLGLPAVTSGLCAGGGVDLVHFHCRTANDRLEVGFFALSTEEVSAG
jgi:ubiquinone biosynthesis protein COQ9